MTYMDTVIHAFAGMLAGMPVYLPKEPLTYEAEAPAHAVVLGDGSGGLPIAVASTSAVVALALDALADDMACGICRGDVEEGKLCTGCQNTGLLYVDAMLEPLAGGLASTMDQAGFEAYDLCTKIRALGDKIAGDEEFLISTAIDFSAWSGNTWANVVQEAAVSPFGSGYDEAKHGAIEYWLACCLGEFILVSDEERLQQALPTPLTGEEVILLLTVRKYASQRALFAAIAQYSRGYAVAGRNTHLGEPLMHF